MWFRGSRLIIFLIIIISFFFVNCSTTVESSSCRYGCDLALASFSVWRGSNLPLISQLFDNTSIIDIINTNINIPNKDSIRAESRINIPFRCDCIDSEFLGRVFQYNVVPGDTYELIANKYYSNLTTKEWLMRGNSYRDSDIIPDNVILNVTVNCSCGNIDVSKDYGLFVTYPLRIGESLESIALVTNTSAELIRKYNPGANFSGGSGLVYIPGRDTLGKYPPMPTSKGNSSTKSIAGIAVAAISGVSFLVCIIYVGICRKNRKKKEKVAPKISEPADISHQSGPDLSGIAVDKSVEFSYEELAESTNDFSISNKIGEGGFGAVYYAELRGKRTAIKQMNRQARAEFLAELNILTRVHHLNLVCLIGYCVDRSLFLVYEYVENGNLSQHLRGRNKLPWPTRVQIALDSARGLEYIHEHTIPVYIHRDVKSANILINENFRAKVGDFGLTKLVKNGHSKTLPTSFIGTFGYMPPEYGNSSIVSTKVDVFAFGVVLYELISSKEAIVKEDGVDEPTSLVALFDEAHNHSNPNEGISRLIDPKLGDNYPLDSVHKMAQLAKACTAQDPQMRPTMKSVVVALMALSALTEDL